MVKFSELIRVNKVNHRGLYIDKKTSKNWPSLRFKGRGEVDWKASVVYSLSHCFNPVLHSPDSFNYCIYINHSALFKQIYKYIIYTLNVYINIHEENGMVLLDERPRAVQLSHSTDASNVSINTCSCIQERLHSLSLYKSSAAHFNF